MLVARRSGNSIMPAPTVALVKRSIRMKLPVSRFLVGIEGERLAGAEVAEPTSFSSSVLAATWSRVVDVELVLEAR